MGDFIEKRFFKVNALEAGKKEKLLALIKEHLHERDDIIFAYIHGSFAKSEKFRDIDIAVYTKAGSGFLNMESDISAELTSLTRFEIEVRVINNAPVAFQMAVIKDGILLFSLDEVARTDFIENVCKHYMEYAHFRNIFLGVDGVRQG